MFEDLHERKQPKLIVGYCQGVPNRPAGNWIFTGLSLRLNQHGSSDKAVLAISQLVKIS